MNITTHPLSITLTNTGSCKPITLKLVVTTPIGSQLHLNPPARILDTYRSPSGITHVISLCIPPVTNYQAVVVTNLPAGSLVSMLPSVL